MGIFLLRQSVGWSCMLIGVVGLFLPILQGSIFLALGALILSRDVRLFRQGIVLVQKRFRLTRTPIKKMRIWVDGSTLSNKPQKVK